MDDINNVLYFCDLKQCANCSYPLCKHTTDINHAINFSHTKVNGKSYFEEKCCNDKSSIETIAKQLKKEIDKLSLLLENKKKGDTK